RDPDDERPHGFDLAYSERDLDQPDRYVLRSPWSGGLELVPLLQNRWYDRVVVLVQVLDRLDGRHIGRSDRSDAGDGQRRQRIAEERAGPVGAFYPRRLRLRRYCTRERRSREHRHRTERRHDEGPRQSVTA